MIRKTVTAAAVSIGLMLAATALPAPAQQDEEEGYKNLQILPVDISRDSLQIIMSAYSSALGVRCSHCHVQQRGKRDFASDDKPTKHVARAMMRLKQDINATLAAAGGDSLVAVDCVTCHHGVNVPRTLQALLLQALNSGGIDAAIDRYRELRAEYYGQAVYNFGEDSLGELAGDLSRGGDDYTAIEFLRLNLEFFPESTFTLAQLAGSLHRIGAINEARMRLDEAVRLDPDDRYVRRQMQRLFGDATDTE